MKDKKIYLSGAISSIPYEESSEWREKIEDCIYELNKINKANFGRKSPEVYVFNPLRHFSDLSLELGLVDDRELMLVELDKLRKTDVVIYNCKHSSSLGSMAEIAIAYEHGIPILAFNEDKEELHPWIKCMCTKIFSNIDTMLSFFVNHYLYDD